MTIDITEEFVAVDGAIYTGAHGTATAPTDGTTPFDVTWTDHGIAAPGSVQWGRVGSFNARMGWQNNIRLRPISDGSNAIEVSFTLIQSNAANEGLFLGATYNVGTDSFKGDPNDEFPLIAFGLDYIDPSSDSTKRLYLPSARVTATEKVTLQATDGVHYAITLQSEYDPDLEAHYEYFPGWPAES